MSAIAGMVQEWLGSKGLDVSGRGIRVGHFMLLTSHGEGYGPPDGAKHLYLLNRDFRDVVFMVRWPRNWWPK